MWWIWILIAVGVFFALVKFTKTKEGTVKALMRLGSFRKMVLAWNGYKLDENWNVVEGKSLHLPGGLRIVGIRGLDDVYRYKFRWRDIHLAAGGKEEVTFHEETIDYILIKPDVYWTTVEEAETTPPERIPLTLQFLITMRVINPYKALFRAPPNWHENIVARLNNLFRDWVATKTLDQILEFRGGETQQVWNEFKDYPQIEIFEEEWGVKIEENGIEIRTIEMAPEYEEAAAREKRMELEAKGVAVETTGTVIEMMARATGRKPDEIREKIKKSTILSKEFRELSEDLIKRRMAIAGGSFLDIRVEGTEGLEKALLNLIGAWKRMPTGRLAREKARPSKRKKSFLDMTGGEFERHMEEEYFEEEEERTEEEKTS